MFGLRNRLRNGRKDSDVIHEETIVPSQHECSSASKVIFNEKKKDYDITKWIRSRVRSFIHSLWASRNNKPIIDVSIVDRNLHQVALFVFITWVVLVVLSFTFSPSDRIFYPPENVRTTCKICFYVHIASLITRLSPLLLSSKPEPLSSGVMVASVTIQIIAGTSNGIMGWLKCPIFIDPVTNCNVNLVRWCEWTPLAFGMSALTESMDAPDWDSVLFFGLSQGVSCFFGLLLPLCPGYVSWTLVMVISSILFFNLHAKLYHKAKRFQTIVKGSTVEEVENYLRHHLAFRLLIISTILWSCMFISYMMGWVFQAHSIDSSVVLADPILDLISKHFYLNLTLQAHADIFDGSRRAERRLNELRLRMSAIWTKSTDVLIVSSQCSFESNIVQTQISPAYAKLIGSDGQHNLPEETFIMKHDISGGITTDKVKRQSFRNILDPIKILKLSGIQDVVKRAWSEAKGGAALFSHEIYTLDGNKIHCEAKLTDLNESSLIIVVRDVTARYKLFEAEKKVVSQITARNKDIQANKFTRHEVKNGLLAAIGICDGLRGQVDDLKTLKNHDDITIPPSSLHTQIDGLEITLHETLDTVIAEVMARDLINGVYSPRIEQVDLHCLLQPYARKSNFFMEVEPNPFPVMEQDPQLLKCIHNNAMTNAVKYGKTGGSVTTVLTYKNESKMIEMKVINEPGLLNDKILKLGYRAKDIVFSQGKSIHNGHDATDTAVTRLSTGDGAWIMRNCAHALEGNCDIDFQPSHTTFTLLCPAKLVVKPLQNNDGEKKFQIPACTWGLAIDDSFVQRKLLFKFLSIVGVSNERIAVKGSTNSEICHFDDFVVEMVSRHPADFFLIIADENMDITTDSGKVLTISGSLSIDKLLKRLGPILSKRVLALVRSANDSSADIKLYESRAHGFVPKAPLKRGRLGEIIHPLWVKRFGSTAVSSHNDCNAHPDYRVLSTNEIYLEAFNFEAELVRSVDRIDLLMNSAPMDSWNLVKELLHALKGDMMTHSTNATSLQALSIINKMRNKDIVDVDVEHQWTVLKTLVTDLQKKRSEAK